MKHAITLNKIRISQGVNIVTSYSPSVHYHETMKKNKFSNNVYDQNKDYEDITL